MGTVCYCCRDNDTESAYRVYYKPVPKDFPIVGGKISGFLEEAVDKYNAFNTSDFRVETKPIEVKATPSFKIQGGRGRTYLCHKYKFPVTDKLEGKIMCSCKDFRVNLKLMFEGEVDVGDYLHFLEENKTCNVQPMMDEASKHPNKWKVLIKNIGGKYV